MQYRTFGRLDWKPSALGFGTLRLPTRTEGEDYLSYYRSGEIREDLATEMIRVAIDGGVNYIDTGWTYHEGCSEPFLGRCLQDGRRDRVRLATKMPTWLIGEPADFDTYLDRQLERLRTDRVDCYLLRNLSKTSWPNVRMHDVFEWAERATADGRIGCLGFSFHDTLKLFKEIVDAYDWAFCQIQYNYMDVEHQAGTAGFHYAAEKGLGVVIMEPLQGGALARAARPAISELWESAPVQRTQADWSLQWLWNQPEASLVLSGMSAMEQVEENLASADRSGVQTLSDEELRIIDQVREAYRALSPIPCTDCQYCLPCPNGVAIPSVFRLHNEALVYDVLDRSRTYYSHDISPEHRANRCVGCGKCEDACPQGIEIIRWLKASHDRLTGGDLVDRGEAATR